MLHAHGRECRPVVRQPLAFGGARRQAHPLRPAVEAKRQRDFAGRDILWEIQFFEGIVAKLPTSVEALQPLAENYTTVGRYHEGLAVDLTLSRLRPDDPLVHYNLGCSLSLVGNVDAAILALRHAVELGYDGVDLMREDTDLDNIREDPRYAEIERSILERQEA